MLRRLLTGLAGRLRRGGPQRRLIVLCYHDLREREDFTSWLRVEASAFEAQLDALAAIGTFIEPDAIDTLNELPSGGLYFLVTFDDGYLNNARLAARLLDDRNVPALFFVSTHHIATGEPFWFDRVVTRLQAANVTRLDLSRFGLREYAFRREDGPRRWTDIQCLLTDIKKLGNVGDTRVGRILDVLDTHYGAIAAPHDDRFRPMTLSELAELSRRPLTHIGSHAHRHDMLPLLSASGLTESVVKSKHLLETLLQRRIVDIAYPNGDHDQRVRAACSDAGYERGYTAAAKVITRPVDRMRIPRLLVGGYDSAADLISAIDSLVVSASIGDGIERVTGFWKHGPRTQHPSPAP